MANVSFDSIRRFLASEGFAARVRTVDLRASVEVDPAAAINTELSLSWSGSDNRLYKRGPLDSNGKMANSTMGVIVGFGALVDTLGALFAATDPTDELSAFANMSVQEARLYAQQTIAFERIQGSALSGRSAALIGANTATATITGREQPGLVRIEDVQGAIILNPNDQIDPTCYVNTPSAFVSSSFQLTHVYRLICADRGEDG